MILGCVFSALHFATSQFVKVHELWCFFICSEDRLSLIALGASRHLTMSSPVGFKAHRGTNKAATKIVNCVFLLL